MPTGSDDLIFEVQFDVVPVIEGLLNFIGAHRIPLAHVFHGLVREHHPPAERVVGLVALHHRDVVALERQLARSREQLSRQRAVVADGAGDIREYRELVARRDAARRAAVATRSSRLDHLRPGDVVAVDWAGPVAVLRHDRGRGAARVLAVNGQRKLIRLGADDFPAGVHRLGTIELPRPFDPRDHTFVSTVAARVAALDVEPASAPTDRSARALVDADAAVAAHPADGDPRLSTRLRALASLDRMERDVARLERRVAGRAETLARTFDRVLELLEGWGYVENWSLTAAGSMLARVYTEGDLLVAEGLRTGLFDGLDPAELAAVVSSIVFERRGSNDDIPLPPRQWPTKQVANRCKRLDKIWRTLQLAERDARLPESRQPDPGFTSAVYAWVRGGDLAAILDDEEMTGGDFVRTIKQIVDLLRQVGAVALDPATAAAARRAADGCVRGVVLASSQVTTQ